MKLKILIRNNLIICIFGIVLCISNLIAINYNNSNTEINVYIWTLILMILTLMLGFSNIKLNKENITLIFLYIAFWIGCFYSQIIKGEFQLIISLVYLVGPILLLINKKIEKNFNILLLSSFIASLPLMLNIQSSNTFGLLLTISFVSLYCSAFNLRYVYYLMGLAPITLYIVFLTGSRTSLIAYFIFIILLYLKLFVFTKQNLQLIFLNNLFIIAINIIMIFVFDRIYELVFHKRANTDSNFLADRQIFWEGTFKYGLKMWGNGKDFFMERFSIGNSHNFFIEILGIYGIIPLITFLIFIFYFLFIILKLNSNEKYNVLLFLLFFFLTSMTEDLFFLNNRLITYHFIFLLFLNKVIVLNNNKGGL